jgi:hypothetical protein
MKNPSPNSPGFTRFGYGLYPPAQQVREKARAYFLDVVRATCPEVMYGLKNELLPVYQRWAASQGPGTKSLPGSFLELQQQEPDVADAVMTWCRKSYLIGCLDPEPEWHGPDWQRVAHIGSLWPAIKAHETMLAWLRPVGSRWLEADPPQWRKPLRYRYISSSGRAHSWSPYLIWTTTAAKRNTSDMRRQSLNGCCARG